MAGWFSTFAAAWQADWRERRRDRRVLLVLALGLMLALAAALLSALDLRDTARARAEATQAEQHRWLHQGRKNPHSAAHYGVYAFKPQSALAAADPGIERYVGSSVWLEAHKQNEFVYRPVNDAPGTVRQFALTPAFVLQVLVPLALVFLGFGTWAGEREAGALAQLRLQSARLGAVAAARAGVLLALGLALALPAFAAVLWVQAQLPAAESGFDDAGTRWALFGTGYVVYLALWCLAIVTVSAASATLLRSLAVLMGLWAATTLVLPRAAVEWAQGAAPLPSSAVFRQQMEAALGEPHDPAEEKRQQQALMQKHGVTRLEDLPVNWSGISLQGGEEHGNEVFDAHYGRLFAALRAQDEAAARWAWLSPTLAVAGLSAAAAGSDTAHHLQFVQGAEAHRRLIQRLMNDAITATPDRSGQRMEADEALWSRVPPLQFRFEPLGASLWRHALPLLALLAAAVLACHLTLRRLQQGALR
jgi:ABC-2 type transport system permease protein